MKSIICIAECGTDNTFFVGNNSFGLESQKLCKILQFSTQNNRKFRYGLCFLTPGQENTYGFNENGYQIFHLYIVDKYIKIYKEPMKVSENM